MFITPLATISGWLCLRGAVDHLHFSSRLEAVGLIALTVALFTIYLFWTLVSMACPPLGFGWLELAALSPQAQAPLGAAAPLTCPMENRPSKAGMAHLCGLEARGGGAESRNKKYVQAHCEEEHRKGGKPRLAALTS